jgi:hypothetical protein
LPHLNNIEAKLKPNAAYHTMATVEEDEIFTGVPSTYEDLFNALIFFLVQFLLGDVVCRLGLRDDHWWDTSSQASFWVQRPYLRTHLSFEQNGRLLGDDE